VTTQNMGSVDISVRVHQEDGTYWAESGEWPGWSALAETWDALMLRIQESVDIWRPGASWMAVGDPAPSDRQGDTERDSEGSGEGT